MNNVDLSKFPQVVLVDMPQYIQDKLDKGERINNIFISSKMPLAVYLDIFKNTTELYNYTENIDKFNLEELIKVNPNLIEELPNATDSQIKTAIQNGVSVRQLGHIDSKQINYVLTNGKGNNQLSSLAAYSKDFTDAQYMAYQLLTHGLFLKTSELDFATKALICKYGFPSINLYMDYKNDFWEIYKLMNNKNDYIDYSYSYGADLISVHLTGESKYDTKAGILAECLKSKSDKQQENYDTLSNRVATIKIDNYNYKDQDPIAHILKYLKYSEMKDVPKEISDYIISIAKEELDLYKKIWNKPESIYSLLNPSEICKWIAVAKKPSMAYYLDTDQDLRLFAICLNPKIICDLVDTEDISSEELAMAYYLDRDVLIENNELLEDENLQLVLVYFNPSCVNSIYGACEDAYILARLLQPSLELNRELDDNLMVATFLADKDEYERQGLNSTTVSNIKRALQIKGERESNE